MRPFCIFVTILTIISCSNLANAQETGGVSVSAENQPAAPVVETQPQEAQQQVPEAQQQVPSEQVPPQEVTPTPAVSEEKPKTSEEILLIDDYLPENSTTEGTWVWDVALKYSGEKSHTQPAAKEIAQHSYKSNPIEVPKRCVIEQYVYLDPNEIPKGIMLKFSVENGPNGGDVGVYWEGEEEVFIYNNDEPMLYYGVLPNAGTWEKLQIYAEDLGLENVKLKGITFITYGGKANWDLTKIRPVKEDEGYPLQEELTIEEFKK